MSDFDLKSLERRKLRYWIYRVKNKTEETPEMEAVREYFKAVDFDLFAVKWDIDEVDCFKVVTLGKPVKDTLQPEVVVEFPVVEDTRTDLTENEPVALVLNMKQTTEPTKEDLSFFKNFTKKTKKTKK